MDNQIIFSGVSLEVFTDMVAEKVYLKMLAKTDKHTSIELSHENILFKSLKEVATHSGVCYQTVSKNLGKITHLAFGRSILIYQSDIENAIRKHDIFSNKGGNK